MSEDVWEKVNEEDIASLRRLKAGEKPNPPSDMVRWGCTLCRDCDSIGDEVRVHMKEK